LTLIFTLHISRHYAISLLNIFISLLSLAAIITPLNNIIIFLSASFLMFSSGWDYAIFFHYTFLILLTLYYIAITSEFVDTLPEVSLTFSWPSSIRGHRSPLSANEVRMASSSAFRQERARGHYADMLPGDSRCQASPRQRLLPYGVSPMISFSFAVAATPPAAIFSCYEARGRGVAGLPCPLPRAS